MPVGAAPAPRFVVNLNELRPPLTTRLPPTSALESPFPSEPNTDVRSRSPVIRHSFHYRHVLQFVPPVERRNVENQTESLPRIFHIVTP